MRHLLGHELAERLADEVALAQALDHLAEGAVRLVELVDAAARQRLHLVQPALAHRRAARASASIGRPTRRPTIAASVTASTSTTRPAPIDASVRSNFGALAALHRVEVQADRPRLAAVQLALAA